MPYLESGQERRLCLSMTRNADCVVQDSVSNECLHKRPHMVSGFQRCVCLCVCGRCVYAHREVKTRSPWILEKHELPLSKPVDNSEWCSMGKWEQEGFSCLSWSGLEAHGWARQRKTKQSMSTPFCAPVHHNPPWTLTRLFALRRVEPCLNILMPSSVLFV